MSLLSCAAFSQDSVSATVQTIQKYAKPEQLRSAGIARLSDSQYKALNKIIQSMCVDVANQLMEARDKQLDKAIKDIAGGGK